MKRKTAMVVMMVVMMVIAFTATCFSAEMLRPTKNGSGYVGTASRMWGNGYFSSLTGTTITGTSLVTTGPDFRYTIASKDWGTASGDWTLSATEKVAALIYVYNAGGATNIVAPAETGRVYTVFNNSGQNVTIKKSGGTGITIANGKVASVMYFQSHATNDYMRVTADQTF